MMLQRPRDGEPGEVAVRKAAATGMPCPSEVPAALAADTVNSFTEETYEAPVKAGPRHQSEYGVSDLPHANHMSSRYR